MAEMEDVLDWLENNGYEIGDVIADPDGRLTITGRRLAHAG
jgi:hypothetical protein